MEKRARQLLRQLRAAIRAEERKNKLDLRTEDELKQLQRRAYARLLKAVDEKGDGAR